MSRLTLLLVVAAATVIAACASPGVPPGGPEDHVPPKLLSVAPDTNTTNQKPSSVTFRFDEVVSETPAGGVSLDKLVIVSPSDGAPRVRWRRSAIQVRPRRDFRPNTTYSITILPGIADLRGNTQTLPFSTIFSTGPTIARTRLAGVVFDWVTGRGVGKAFVQAFRRGDTTFSWIAQADSAGRFELRSFPAGSYIVRAFDDANNNRGLDQRESWDTVGVAVADSARIEMYAFVHDTIGPRIDRLSVLDSVTLSIDFDKALDPSSAVMPAMFVVLAADSTPTSVVGLPSDSALTLERTARARAKGDTAQVRAALDSARRDSVVRDSTRREAARTPRPALEAPSGRPGARGEIGSRVPLPQSSRTRGASARVIDTMPLPKATRASPPMHFNLRLATPLKYATTYRLRATGTRGLLGNARTSDKVFITPKAPAPPDTTRRSAAPTPPARP